MKRLIEGQERSQVTLMPECLQTAVDAKHHLIVAHEVTSVGHDRAQLSKMALAAREAMGKKQLKAYADRGYFMGPQIKACDDAGIKAYVPKPMTSTARANGRFDKSDFIYIARDDEYQCPAERSLRRGRRAQGSLCPSRAGPAAVPAGHGEVRVRETAWIIVRAAARYVGC